MLVDTLNDLQKTVRASFTPFFKAIQDEAKLLDKAMRDKEKAQSELIKQARVAVAEAKTKDNKELLKAAESQLKALNALSTELKEVKALLAEVKADRVQAEYFFGHIEWLQARFGQAKYEDVTGLCKLATPEEVKEQDYSLNAGRYVGVVIEEDGKSEEEFREELNASLEQFLQLSNDAKILEQIINTNLKGICNE